MLQAAHDRRVQQHASRLDVQNNMRKCFEVLNPTKGAVSVLVSLYALKPENRLEFIRGGIVRVVALFEGYVKEMMQDAFTAALLERVDNLQILKGVWPNSQTAVQNALLHETCRQEATKVKIGAFNAFNMLS